MNDSKPPLTVHKVGSEWELRAPESGLVKAQLYWDRKLRRWVLNGIRYSLSGVPSSTGGTVLFHTFDDAVAYYNRVGGRTAGGKK